MCQRDELPAQVPEVVALLGLGEYGPDGIAATLLGVDDAVSS